jgi:hypothetical protein
VGDGDAEEDVGLGDGEGDADEVVGDGDAEEDVGLGAAVVPEGGGGKLSTGRPASAPDMKVVQVCVGYPPPVKTDMPPTPFSGACGSFLRSR